MYQPSAKWWTEDASTSYQTIWKTLARIDDNQRVREQKNLINMQLYMNQSITGLTPDSYMPVAIGSLPGVRMNLIYSVISTLTSKITKNKPRVLFLPNDGDYSNRKNCKNLTKFLDGIFYQTGFYQEAIKMFVDALVFDMGALKIYIEDKEIKVERVFPNEIKVDDADSINGKPQQLHQIKYVPVEALINRFPEKEGDILLQATSRSIVTSATVTDMVKVAESWKLPSKPGKKDGKRIISIEGCVLEEEEWSSGFPFVFYRWTEPLLGFYGQGVAEQLIGFQTIINKALKMIQLSAELGSVPYWLVENSSKVNFADMTNDIHRIIRYSMNPPQMVTPNAVSTDLYQLIDLCEQKAFQKVGISQMSISAEKPQGVDSGVAMQNLYDIESERFYADHERYANCFLKAAELFIECAKSIPGYTVKIDDNEWAKQLSWKEINLHEDAYVMRMYPANFLPTQPAGKLNMLEKLISMQIIQSREEIMDQFQYPDMDKLHSTITSPKMYIDRLIEQMLDPDEPKYTAPDGIMDLKMALKAAQYAKQDAENKGAPRRNIELLVMFMEQCTELLSSANPPAPPQQQPAPMPPPGV